MPSTSATVLYTRLSLKRRGGPARAARLSGWMILAKLLGHVQDSRMDPNLDSCPEGKEEMKAEGEFLPCHVMRGG